MSEWSRFHERKFREFQEAQQRALENEKYHADLQRRALRNPTLNDLVLRAEQTVTSYKNDILVNFVWSIVGNLNNERKQLNMPQWAITNQNPQTEVDKRILTRQRELINCATEFYKHCVNGGLEKECQTAGLNLSHLHAPSPAHAVPVSVTQAPPIPQTTLPNMFFIDRNGQRRGPINDQQLRTLALQKVIIPETPMETEFGHKGLAGQIPNLFAAVPSSFAQPAAPALQASPMETAFMQRCPEIDLSVIPTARRLDFIQRYEQVRPQLEGDNILCFLTQQEIATDPYLQQFRIEALQHVNINGIPLIHCRILSGGKDYYNQLLSNYSHAFVANYPKSFWADIGKGLTIAAPVLLIIGCITKYFIDRERA